MALNQIVIGAGAQSTSIPNQLTVSPRGSNLGATVVTELHGRYYEQAYRKNLFKSLSTAQTLSVAGTAMTGHIIWNGSASVNLVLQKIILQVSVTSATMTGIGLASTVAGAQTVAPTTTTAITKAGNCFLGGAASQSTQYTIATTLATTTDLALAHNTAAINTVGMDQIVIDLEGSVIVPPFTAVCLTALGAASAASAVTSTIIYEEVPV
jgi:hypothetical protein